MKMPEPLSDANSIAMSAEEAALHKEYRRLLMVREDERDHARIAEVSAAINAFHPSLRPLDEEEIDQCIADLKARKRLEQLRNLPRVTAADRERYKRWEQEARAELAEVEPTSTRLERAYLQAAMRRRGWVVLRGHYAAGDTPLTRDEWRDHWRSLPDYDGPPMRAPSGPVFELFDCSGTPAQEFSTITNVYLRERISDAQAQAYAELLQHFAAMARRGECEFVGFGLIDATPKDAYGQPSAGGRGWCRGLAGVSK